MSKPWVIVIFVLWTIVLLLAAPFIFSFSTNKAFKVVAEPTLNRSATLNIVEARPILDWTGRLKHLVKVEVTSGSDILASASLQKYSIHWTSKAEQGAAANP